VHRQKGGIEDENLVDTQITQLQAQVTDLEQSRAMLARQNEDLQQQVQTATSQHVKQCEELQAILVEAQIAIQHLRADKVCTECILNGYLVA
jgi:DNA anti-recombination protein RmuC